MAGRKPKHNISELKNKINKYTEKYPNKKIRLSNLEKEFNIERHIWRDNKELSNYIEEINKENSIYNIEELSEIIDKNINNKDKLLKNIINFINKEVKNSNITKNSKKKE